MFKRAKEQIRKEIDMFKGVKDTIEKNFNIATVTIGLTAFGLLCYGIGRMNRRKCMERIFYMVGFGVGQAVSMLSDNKIEVVDF